MQLFDSLYAVFFYGVCHRYHSGVVAVGEKHKRRLSLSGQDLGLVEITLRYLSPAGDESDASAYEFHAVQRRHDSVARQYAESGHIFSFYVLFHSVVDYRLGQRMLALLLQRVCQLEQTVLIRSFRGNYIRYPGLTAGYCSGLVQSDYLYLSGLFQDFRSLEEYAVLRSDAVADHYCYRRGESQSAGAAYDQHRYAAGQSEGHVFSGDEPRDEGHHGDADDRGHEYARDLIRKFCDGRLCCGGIAHHLYDLGQRGVLAYSRGPAHQVA